MRRFSELVPKDTESTGLKLFKLKLFSRPVVYRMLAIGSVGLALGSAFILTNKKGKIGALENSGGHKYYQPSEILETGVKIDTEKFYLIGIVKPGSVQIQPNTLKHTFVITDFIHEIRVHYDGVMPNTLREGETSRVSGEFVNDYNPVDFIASFVESGHDSERVKTTYQLRSRDITQKARPI
ncbi:hypothetical protein SteCoe_32485 [Stentor coeruleus]|uniref:Cytochrome c-type biogenesis protein CcmE n=1 Tax=Stentor coeruleus TaxID=5963 RepID=A0A1R2AYW7_9CILI|nr:hypothetical protein SteCoe_32485 [Stentor coeruleus]